jgi:hypothetical protein
MFKYLAVVLVLAGCQTNRQNRDNSSSLNDVHSNAIVDVCRKIIGDQIKSECFQIIDGKRYHSEVASICGSIIVPQIANLCLSGTHSKTYSPEQIAQCKGYFTPQDKTECMITQGTWISFRAKPMKAVTVCENGVFTKELRQRCLQKAQSQLFDENAPSLCDAILEENPRYSCVESFAGKRVNSAKLQECFKESQDDKLLACAKKVVASQDTPSTVPQDNSSYCSGVIGDSIKQECVAVVNSGKLYAPAAARCKQIIVPQLAISCYSAILNKTYSENEIERCKSIVPQQVVSCFERTGTPVTR